MSATPPQSTIGLHGTFLLEKWRVEARTANIAHLRATDRFRSLALGFGGLSSVLAAVAGSTVLATFSKSSLQGVRLAAGLVAMLSAVIAALTSRMGYAQRSEAHRHASRRYGEAVREIELLEELLSEGAQSVPVTPLVARLEAADEAAPNVPPGIWTWAWNSVREESDSGVDASTLGRHRRIAAWFGRG